MVRSDRAHAWVAHNTGFKYAQVLVCMYSILHIYIDIDIDIDIIVRVFVCVYIIILYIYTPRTLGSPSAGKQNFFRSAKVL